MREYAGYLDHRRRRKVLAKLNKYERFLQAVKSLRDWERGKRYIIVKKRGEIWRLILESGLYENVRE